MGVVSEHHERRDELGCPDVEAPEPADAYDRLDIESIKRRALSCDPAAVMGADIHDLIAEVEKLEKRAERLQEAVDAWHALWKRARRLLPHGAAVYLDGDALVEPY